MPDPRDDPGAAPVRPAFADEREDFDDEFESRWTPTERARRLVLGPAIAFIGIGSILTLGMLVLAWRAGRISDSVFRRLPEDKWRMTPALSQRAAQGSAIPARYPAAALISRGGAVRRRGRSRRGGWERRRAAAGR